MQVYGMRTLVVPSLGKRGIRKVNSGANMDGERDLSCREMKLSGHACLSLHTNTINLTTQLDVLTISCAFHF